MRHGVLHARSALPCFERDAIVPALQFNGELDRYRSNYYPSLFYPKVRVRVRVRA